VGYHEDGSSLLLRNSVTNIQSTYNCIQPNKFIRVATTLIEERRLRVFGTRVQRISGPERDEVTGELRRLHSEELNDL
jgi:DNA-binding MurR/RpiR family transcriptional regulator